MMLLRASSPTWVGMGVALVATLSACSESNRSSELAPSVESVHETLGSALALQRASDFETAALAIEEARELLALRVAYGELDEVDELERDLELIEGMQATPEPPVAEPTNTSDLLVPQCAPVNHYRYYHRKISRYLCGPDSVIDIDRQPLRADDFDQLSDATVLAAQSRSPKELCWPIFYWGWSNVRVERNCLDASLTCRSDDPHACDTFDPESENAEFIRSTEVPCTRCARCGGMRCPPAGCPGSCF